MERARDFFRDGDGRMSMTRLLAFLAFFVSSAVILIEAVSDRGAGGMFGLFVGTYAAQFVGSKAIDAGMGVKKDEGE